MKNFIVLLILTFSLQANAQLNLGLIASQNISLAEAETVKIANSYGYVSHELTFLDIKNSQSYGIFSMYRTGHLYGRAEFTYKEQTANYKIIEYSNIRTNENLISQKSASVDFTLLGGLTYNQWSIGTGPIAHFAVEHPTGFSDTKFVEQLNRDVTFGFVGTLGFDMGRIHLDIRYEKTFGDIAHGMKYNGRKQHFGKTPNFLKIAMGYTLL